MLSNFARRTARLTQIPIRMNGWGEGAGHGGGKGGAIRDAGGAFGKREAAFEEKYFREVQAEQFKSMKDHMENEIRIHEQNIRLHQEAINRHKQELKKIKNKDD